MWHGSVRIEIEELKLNDNFNELLLQNPANKRPEKCNANFGLFQHLQFFFSFFEII